MLHSALPRAYLGAYLGAGYLDEPYLYQHYHHQYQYHQHQHGQQQQQQQHSQQPQLYAGLDAWSLAARAASPCPLDLSLKPPPSPIEVDDEEDRRSREEARSHHSAESLHRYYPSEEPQQPQPQHLLVVDDADSRCSSQLSYGQPQQQPQQQQQPPMTPPSTPSPPQCPPRRPKGPSSPQLTPGKQSGQPGQLGPRAKRKGARRLKFDEDTSSPVSGTVILGPDEAVLTGDIDPAFNIVEVTEEARAELAKIENRLGPYQCKLCRQLHDDAFQLAQHRCSRIAHVEYRCPECDKRFSCPANLASHRRWHKPRPDPSSSSSTSASASTPNSSPLACSSCPAKFAKPQALRKHLALEHNNNNNSNNNHHHHSAAPERA